MKKSCIYIQKSPSSCGACSIASIVSYYGGYVPLDIIIEDTLTDKNGTNAFQMVRALKKYGFVSYGLNIKLCEIKKSKLPAIASTTINGFDHFLVIYEIDKEKVITMNPEMGKKIYSLKEFERTFNNCLIISIPLTKIIKYEKSNEIKKFIKTNIKIHKWSILSIFILSIIIILLSLVLNMFIKLLDKNNIYVTSLIFIFLLIIKYILEYIKTNKDINLTNKISSNVNNSFIKHIFDLKVNYLHNKRVGEIVDKINEVDKIKNFILEFILSFMIELILLIMSLILLISLSSTIFIYELIIVIIYIIFNLLTFKKLYKLDILVFDKYNNYGGNLVEYLSGIESIKNLGGSEYFLNNLNNSYDKFLSSSKSFNRYNSFLLIIKSFIKEFTSLLIIFIGFNLILCNDFSLVSLIVYISVSSLFLDSIESLTSFIHSFVRVKTVFRSANEFLDVKKEFGGSLIKVSFKSLKIVNLNYSYDYYHKTLNNINLEINKGDKILLNGPSGIGKSTLVKILSKLITEFTGKIYLNDLSYTYLNENDIRNILVYTGQNEKLFTGTIKDNITLGKTNDKKLYEVIKLCKLDEIINKRTLKLDTPIMEEGTNFSGGEKSRIILARSLFKCTDILIIDETLSSVSESLENEILNNLLGIENLTLIYITHRCKNSYFKNIINFREDGTYDYRREQTS